MFVQETALSPETWEWIGSCARVVSYMGPLTTAVLGIVAFVYKRTGDVKENTNRFALNSAGKRYAVASIFIAVVTVAASILKDKADSVAKNKAANEARTALLQDLGGSLEGFAEHQLGPKVKGLSDAIDASKTSLKKGIDSAAHQLDATVAASASDITRREREDKDDDATNSEELQAVGFQISTDGPVPNAPQRKVKGYDSLLNALLVPTLSAHSKRGVAWQDEIIKKCDGKLNEQRCAKAVSMLVTYENVAPLLRLFDPDESAPVLLTMYTGYMSPTLHIQGPCSVLASQGPLCVVLSDMLHPGVDFSGSCSKIGAADGEMLCFHESETQEEVARGEVELGEAENALPIKLQIIVNGPTAKLTYLPKSLLLYEEIELKDKTRHQRSYVLKLSELHQDKDGALIMYKRG